MPSSLLKDYPFFTTIASPTQDTPFRKYLFKPLPHKLTPKYVPTSHISGLGVFPKIEATAPDINIWFIRRERTYTTLKYSRTPAYDIVSGGVAALLAGFLGFLISEKFGFELLDSGDFYMIFFYLILTSLILRVLISLTGDDFTNFSRIFFTFWKFLTKRF